MFYKDAPFESVTCHIFLHPVGLLSISNAFSMSLLPGREQETRGRKQGACLCVLLSASVHSFACTFMFPFLCTVWVSVFHGICDALLICIVSQLITDFCLLG